MSLYRQGLDAGDKSASSKIKEIEVSAAQKSPVGVFFGSKGFMSLASGGQAMQVAAGADTGAQPAPKSAPRLG